VNLAVLRFLAMTLGPSITATARPAVTFWAVQLTVAALVYQQLVSVPDSLAWMISTQAIVVVGILAGLEAAARHDPDIAALLRDLQLDKITGALGALTSALLFVTLGLPETEAAAIVEGAAPTPSGGVLEATAQAAASERGDAVKVGAVGGAIGINMGLSWMRAQLLSFVDDFELGRWWARIETGGVVGLLVVLPLLPLLALAMLVVWSLLLSAVALTARAAQRAIDEHRRVPCPSCEHRVRVEASLCPECGEPLEPTAEPASGARAAWDALRGRDPRGSPA
jgi:hypothetical protein